MDTPATPFIMDSKRMYMMNLLSPFDRLLGGLTALAVAMIALRVWYFGSLHYTFLIFNLALAAIPWLLAKLAVQVQQKVPLYAMLLLWLLFLPNALYIVTDLVHLRKDAVAPVWYDTLLVFTAAVAGLFMGFASLLDTEKKLMQLLAKRTVHLLVPVVLFLASFGIYLGRYQRWYSWDIVTRPLALAESIVVRIMFPLEHGRTWGMTLILTLLFVLLYNMIKQLHNAPSGVTVKDVANQSGL